MYPAPDTVSQAETLRASTRENRAGFTPSPLTLLLTVTLLGGCMTTEVNVPTENFPVPLVEKLPLTMGLHLPPELIEYEFFEDLGEAGEYVIDIGDAQPNMFQNLLIGMFNGAELVEDPAAPPVGVDAVLVPRIVEMQFSTPQQTRTDYFEVWMRYSFQLFSSDGTLLGEWGFPAYGKANTQNFMIATTSPALRQAALNACRDAMAFFTVQFRTVPTVQQWLQATTIRGTT